MAASQQQMHAFMAQQATFQHEMFEMRARANCQKQKANPPKFNGRADEDLELRLFQIEEHFATYSVEQNSNDSRFVDMVVPFLNSDVMSWYREFKLAMGENPRPWPLLKQQIRARYRDSDYEFKLLTKMHDLRVTGTQQEYRTKFMQLLSQSSIDMPEVCKRWLYQQNLRAETSSYISQNIPTTLKDTIEHAQRYEDARKPQQQRQDTPPVVIKQTRIDNRYPQGKGKHGELNRETPSKTIPSSKGRSVGWRPSEDNASAVQHAAELRQACGSHDHIDYYTDDVDFMRHNSSEHGHLQQTGSIHGQPATAFVDSGASFNAVSPLFTAQVGLSVRDYPKPLVIRLGGGKQTVIPRKVTTFPLSFQHFTTYITSAFVMDIPENCYIMLGMPWLHEVNPIIDWAAKTIRPRPPVRTANCVGGSRYGGPRKSPRQRAEARRRNYFIHGYQSEVGCTRLVRPRDLQNFFRAADNEICFFINPGQGPMTETCAAAWAALKDTKDYPLLSAFRNSVFRSELPSIPPSRQNNMDATINVADSIPVHRKQFPFSKEQRDAVV
ncbi:unnamed protein product [Phytophthora fragariaefolia]|uniref:Unnamed protein product n=1 Tax=Phytophthora fragariaefolia TaxID=1490495 RepID=A0A9W6YAV9_9STRA|nr:unnamed protein product [Phytophthora fragariaefolia]